MMEHMRNSFPSAIRHVNRSVAPSTEDTAVAQKKDVTPSVCPLCKGRGYGRHDVSYGHPDFGKVFPCQCKIAEQRERERHELVELSGITQLHRFKRATFETFNPDLPHVRNAYRTAKQFAACPMGWLVMTGPYGCGKTHLAVAIAKQRVDAGDSVLVQTVPDLLDHLRSAFSPASEETYDEMFKKMREVDLLVLDDYGAEQGSPWAKEKMFQLINHRYNQNLPMIVTSNNIGLEGVDPRVRSRLLDQEIVNLVNMVGARDYRLKGSDVDEEEE